MNVKSDFVEFITNLQASLCLVMEEFEDDARFGEDRWQRPGGGGGLTRIMQDGKVFEKAGVNISEVEGEVTPALAKQLNTTGSFFFATGISLVIHPLSPLVPATHANFRYFELYDQDRKKIDSWFGGGADLTPYYLCDEDVIHFHSTFKKACDRSSAELYPAFKTNCDAYFNNAHRGSERRGVGGIFYDYLRPTQVHSETFLLNLSKACGNAFAEAYMPIVKKSANKKYSDAQVYWQQIRRGRYVEFNLIHDRGTLFGLRSNGRTESILMSLPPKVRFDYNDTPKPGTEEAKLLDVLRFPKNWVE